MATSSVEWAHHVFDPWRGGSAPYADKLSKRNPGVLGVWGPNGTRVVASESAWKEPLKWNRLAEKAGERHRVFCASLADVFEGEDTMPAESVVPVDDARQRLLYLIAKTPHLDWLLLTKRPENVIPTLERQVNRDRWGDGEISGCCVATRWLDGEPPDNVWLGTSIENQPMLNERIPHLLKVPAAVRFLSCEPLLGKLEFSDVTRRSDALKVLGQRALSGIHWVIVGGESGPNARPMHPDWARSIRDQCQAIGVPFFFKQWGEWAPFTDNIDRYYRNGHAVFGDTNREYNQALKNMIRTLGGTKLVDDRPEGWEPRMIRNGMCINGGRGNQLFLLNIGKKAAGRLLDGREWNEMPEVANAAR